MDPASSEVVMGDSCRYEELMEYTDVAMQAMAAFDTGVLRFMMSKRLEAALKIQTALIYRDDTVRPIPPYSTIILWADPTGGTPQRDIIDS